MDACSQFALFCDLCSKPFCIHGARESIEVDSVGDARRVVLGGGVTV